MVNCCSEGSGCRNLIPHIPFLPTYNYYVHTANLETHHVLPTYLRTNVLPKLFSFCLVCMLVYYYFKKHDLIHYSFMKQDVFSGVEMTHDISKSLLRMLFYSAVHTLAGFLLDSRLCFYFICATKVL